MELSLCNMSVVIYLLSCSFSYITYSKIKSIYLLLLTLCSLHLYSTISTGVNDFTGFIQPTISYNARNRKLSDFSTYGTHLVTKGWGEWGWGEGREIEN